ncbi:polysaccharide deacetylase family protein [Campylobacter geochelonis]|uniref:polysaccharide deacetylase family protein n=1 Tax=Campylobacter geochelonis TaxID=1780362 RepID=UPI0007707B08|nr:polysaccharide deacetylase family protein [Campylobacter geochelonis]CZE50910.1 Bifunctional xylanase/deacetylase precursor [Campylobacter geochelonis]
METKKRKNKISFIVIGVCLLAIGWLSYENLELKAMIEKDVEIQKDSQIKLIETNIEILNKEMDKNVLLGDIAKLNKTDEIVASERKNYYKHIKLLEDKILSGESDQKIAYLTFDDGPYFLTRKFLEVLKKYDILATFFTIGLKKDACRDEKNQSCGGIYKIQADSGHTMANHTYSHAIFKGLYKSDESFIADVKKQEALLLEKTGQNSNIFRFPGGSTTPKKLKNAMIKKLEENGYGWVDWTADDNDGTTLKNSKEGIDRIKQTINQKIEVVLLHDYSKITLEILPDIIEYLQNNGYILLPLFYESSVIKKAKK